jgi:hypothetical protein
MYNWHTIYHSSGEVIGSPHGTTLNIHCIATATAEKGQYTSRPFH